MTNLEKITEETVIKTEKEIRDQLDCKYKDLCFEQLLESSYKTADLLNEKYNFQKIETYKILAKRFNNLAKKAEDAAIYSGPTQNYLMYKAVGGIYEKAASKLNEEINARR